ncbi:sugar isomerase domain-containing protein [Rhizobium sp. P38BS-XIX]|uniref:sugar isomerase domain-containing protein n=1 Tax=Rhizobium sp. P38BS-XIX TaxID=2726740 RepID=UPI0014569BE4|nr:sugar isomerase domain-containing protein [Rhizobium sp. P38BS-XIX]NLS01001.1 sugar isomerase domain-containing protein [Rhizobium sp. P38BS-XIX]
MPDATKIDVDALCDSYLTSTQALMHRILAEEKAALDGAASKLADQIAADRLVHIFGPGGHSNLAAQEVFFRAGGLMHISAILDEGTLLSNGALRSMAIERTPGYGKIVIANNRIDANDLLILINAYGINAALIDAALEARHRGAFLIGISSHEHANKTSPDHPARHPTKRNLHDLVDIAIDCKVPIGDAVVTIAGMSENIAAISTFANAFALNCLVIRTVAKLVERGIEPPVWRSGNAPGGDEANGRFIANFQGRVKAL